MRGIIQIPIQCIEPLQRREKLKDKDGFTIKCKYSDWRIIDDDWNHDFVCMNDRHGTLNRCYGEDSCPYYKAEKEADT